MVVVDDVEICDTNEQKDGACEEIVPFARREYPFDEEIEHEEDAYPELDGEVPTVGKKGYVGESIVGYDYDENQCSDEGEDME